MGLGSSPAFGHVPRQDLASPRKAGTVQHQRRGDQRAVVTPVLGASPLAQRAVGQAAIVGIGQIAEHDRVRDPEQRRCLLPQSLLQRLAVFPEETADAVERFARQRPLVRVKAEQFGQSAVTLQPSAGLPFAGGVDRPGRDKRGGNARVPQAAPASLEGV